MVTSVSMGEHSHMTPNQLQNQIIFGWNTEPDLSRVLSYTSQARTQLPSGRCIHWGCPSPRWGRWTKRSWHGVESWWSARRVCWCMPACRRWEWSLRSAHCRPRGFASPGAESESWFRGCSSAFYFILFASPRSLWAVCVRPPLWFCFLFQSCPRETQLF